MNSKSLALFGMSYKARKRRANTLLFEYYKLLFADAFLCHYTPILNNNVSLSLGKHEQVIWYMLAPSQ